MIMAKRSNSFLILQWQSAEKRCHYALRILKLKENCSLHNIEERSSAFIENEVVLGKKMRNRNSDSAPLTTDVVDTDEKKMNKDQNRKQNQENVGNLNTPVVWALK